MQQIKGLRSIIITMAGRVLQAVYSVVSPMVRDAIERGAVGVDMGRNIWQAEHPVAAIKAVRAVVHENTSAAEAMDIFEKAKKGKKQG